MSYTFLNKCDINDTLDISGVVTTTDNILTSGSMIIGSTNPNVKYNNSIVTIATQNVNSEQFTLVNDPDYDHSYSRGVFSVDSSANSNIDIFSKEINNSDTVSVKGVIVCADSRRITTNTGYFHIDCLITRNNTGTQGTLQYSDVQTIYNNGGDYNVSIAYDGNTKFLTITGESTANFIVKWTAGLDIVINSTS